MGLEPYAEHDGLGLAALVRAGEVSAPELVDAAIATIERLNPQLNAVVHTDFERAREAAAAGVPEGPFAGVPMLLKDLGAEAVGQPSTSSCRLNDGWTASADCELVRRYRASGAVILGRCNTPEFGIMGTTEPRWRGPTRNPWSLEHSPGGSSGGSGAAVAARLVPLAHGGDGGGSIRIPASDCDLFDLKPTRARTPSGPWAGERWGGFVSEHVLTRSVRDSAAMLDATRGPDPGAPYQVTPPQRPYAEEVGAAVGTLRIAFTTRALFGRDTHAENAAAVHDAARLAEGLGHEVEEACPEYDQDELVRHYFYTVATNVAADLAAAEEVAGRRAGWADAEPATWLLASIGRVLPAAEAERVRRIAHRAARELTAFFDRYDVLLTAATAAPPPRLGEMLLSGGEAAQIRLLSALGSRKLLMFALETMAADALSRTPNTQLFNETGQPAMSVPLHWTPEGLPVGTQWVGRFGDEATLFRLAAQLEEARPWIGRLPPLLQG